jgi:plasmid stabilization system protein ParE
VIWAPLAIERAYEEARFIAEDKPDAALRWLDGLFDSTDRLERFPQGGRIVPEIQLPDYREIIYGKHRVIYRVEKRRIWILTVRRGRQLLRRSEILDEE